MVKLIVANWKCNPDSTGRAVRLARGVLANMPKSKNAEVVLCPPFVFLEPLSKLFHASRSKFHVALGAQDVFWGDVGPYTGEVSWHQLKHLSVSYVIIGHSDRRRLLGETDEMVNKKVLAALAAGLKVVLCVGDIADIRKRGMSAVRKFVTNQLKQDLKGIQNLKPKTKNLVICYEPVWAISTARSKTSRDNADTPENAALVIRFIKNYLKPKTYNLKPVVIYGGSVNPKNAQGFLGNKEIDGALVGAASLYARQFRHVIEATP